jgi:hypothetical protein
LNDNGQLQELYLKWWKNEKPLNCDLYEEKNLARSLSFNGVAGVFFFVACGLGLAFFIIILERIWFKYYSKVQ